MHSCMNYRIPLLVSVVALGLAVSACGDNGNGGTMVEPLDPDTAPKVSIDRFSKSAGHLMIRDKKNGLPGANEPIDFDSGEPFITMGLGPNGQHVQYYNFDVQPVVSAPIYALFKEGKDKPVKDQLNIIGVIPGDGGYSDFWHVHKVTVPDDYVANTLTSVDAIMGSGYAIEATDMVVNCPIVPEGSKAKMRYGDEDPGLVRGWYEDQVVFYFNFLEKELIVKPPKSGSPSVPLSDILVSFNINPDQDGGGPASGFMTEAGTAQTHNVVQTLPEDDGYSPLWDVDVYDNADFDDVHDYASAQAANVLAQGVATVNCPIVSVEPLDPDTASKVSIDRFSESAGHLMVRDSKNGLPGANEPIDFDSGEPFITMGLGPNGEHVQYYNFDVQPIAPAPIYALFKKGKDMPVSGQLNIIGVIPGDGGYNDFWHVHKVTVPDDYVANTLTSVSAITESGYPIDPTDIIVNCPVVPEGSTAELRYSDEDPGLVRGWYNNQVVFYFNFLEKDLMVDSAQPSVPLSDILVTFNINPDQDGGGPASGFMTEAGTAQTHNVVQTLPEDDGYSPLWDVDVYDNADFDAVHDYASAQAANVLAQGVATVNCPIVSVE